MTYMVFRDLLMGFPINRCHQRMATLTFWNDRNSSYDIGFQSIGVTNEW